MKVLHIFSRCMVTMHLSGFWMMSSANAQNFTWDGSIDNFTALRWNGGAGLVTWPGAGNNAIIPSGSLTVDQAWAVNDITISGGNLELVGPAASIPVGFPLTISNATDPAFVLLRGGTVNRSQINIGQGTGTGRLHLTNDAVVTTSGELWVGSNANAAGFGELTINSGTLTTGSWLAIGRGGDGVAGFDTRGVLNMEGGTLNVGSNGNLAIGAFRVAANATSQMNLSGGTVNVGRGIFVGENANGYLDVSGGQLNISTVAVDVGLQIRGIMNLRGGVVSTPWVVRRGGGEGILNFNGGILQASQNNANFLGGLGQAQVFAGGAIIDSGEYNIAIAQPLNGASGEGVSADGLIITGGSGYTSAPIVEISGGGGSGATARAIVTDGVVTGIEITNPGTGYLSPPTFSLFGGGGTGASIGGSATLITNESGGLTKNGSGRLTLSGISSYAGATQVNEGTLFVDGAISSDINLADGANLGGTGSTTSSVTMPGNHQFFFNPAAAGSFVASAVNVNGATIRVIPDGAFTPVTDKVILASADPIQGQISNFQSGNPRMTLSLNGAGTELLASYMPANLVWTGGDANFPNAWNVNKSSNWADGNVYIQGDAVTFDDTATAESPVLVELEENINPSNVTFANLNQSYELSGLAIGGTTGILVNGGGVVTLANSNTFTGATTVRAGTLEVTGSLSTGAALTVADASGGKAILRNSGTIDRSQLIFGDAIGSVGAGYQTAGIVRTTVTGGGSTSLGLRQGAFGFYRISGGSLTTDEIAIGTWGVNLDNQGGSGLMEITGGTVTNTGWMVMNRSAGPVAPSQQAGLHVSGGSLTYAGGGLVANWGGSGNAQTAQITVSGTGSIATVPLTNAPINLSQNGSAANVGILNLNGGFVTPSAVIGARGFLNFNGGVLRANAASTNFLAVNTACVFPGGAVIDTNNQNITIAQPLLAPSGDGISATGLIVEGSGFISPPLVEISGGGGFGATAVASIDAAGNLTGITMTNPGVNYTSTPTFTLVGGGGTGSITGTATLVPNTSGGLTKNGAGTLTLTGQSTFTGATTVSAGLLSIGNGTIDGSISATSNIVNNAAITWNLLGNHTIAATITGTGAVTKSGAGALVLTGNLNHSGLTLVTAGGLALSGSNSMGPVQINGNAAIARVTGGTTTVASAGGNTYVTGGSTLEIDGGSLRITGGAAWFSVGDHPILPDGNGTLLLTSGSFTNNNSWGIPVGAGNAGTGTITINGGTFTADDAVNNGIILGEGAGGNGTLHLNGGILITDRIATGAGVGTLNCNGGKLQSTGALADLIPNNANMTSTVQSGGLRLGGTSNFSISEPMAGTGGITKEDANTVTLVAQNSYTGHTIVSAGSLTLGNGADNSNLADSADVEIATGATLNLNFSGTDTIDELWLGGVQQAAGVYDNTHSSGLITGTGSLTVTNGPSTSDYQTWADSFQPSIGLATSDDDGDGLTNFAEYAFGLDPRSATSANPMSQPLNQSTGQFKFTRRATPATTNVNYSFEYSTTLTGSWPTFTPLNQTSNNGTPVEEITVTIPAALLSEPKLFLRVKAEQSQ